MLEVSAFLQSFLACNVLTIFQVLFPLSFLTKLRYTVEPRLSGLFLWSQFGYDYLLVTIKIRSHILFKTTALKGAVKCKDFLLSKSKGSALACRKQ